MEGRKKVRKRGGGKTEGEEDRERVGLGKRVKGGKRLCEEGSRERRDGSRGMEWNKDKGIKEGKGRRKEVEIKANVNKNEKCDRCRENAVIYLPTESPCTVFYARFVHFQLIVQQTVLFPLRVL
jgi:hypothetical protein